MPERTKDNISSLAELLAAVISDYPETDTIWFRGQADASWPLECSLARNGGSNREMPLIRRFKQNALLIMNPKPASEWEWLFTMQHYGLPTRLLDWSESPLAALYFAVSDPKYEDKPAALWALDPHKFNEKGRFDSNQIPCFDDDSHLKSYLPFSVDSRGQQKLSPLAVLAARNTPRILSQQGVFVVFHKNLDPLDISDGTVIWKYVIPSILKRELKNALRVLGIHRLSLFPELDYVAQHAIGQCNE